MPELEHALCAFDNDRIVAPGGYANGNDRYPNLGTNSGGKNCSGSVGDARDESWHYGGGEGEGGGGVNNRYRARVGAIGKKRNSQKSARYSSVDTRYSSVDIQVSILKR